MIDSLRIPHYLGLYDCRRVNLIVGANNSGKTATLIGIMTCDAIIGTPISPHFVPGHNVNLADHVDVLQKFLPTEEAWLLRSLRIVEPNPVREDFHDIMLSRGFLKASTRRLFGLALALLSVPRGGLLLVDEIDTSFHFSVMQEMWEWLIEAAVRLDVQVFATTHSRDCYESLAKAVRGRDANDPLVALYRLERRKVQRDRHWWCTPTLFTQQELTVAVDHGIELR